MPIIKVTPLHMAAVRPTPLVTVMPLRRRSVCVRRWGSMGVLRRPVRLLWWMSLRRFAVRRGFRL
ncbi:hypothetical protein GCM10010971_30530 [Silvimonas amylolytica]|uniref:Uncharacterized protein n=1 Tax=Silvimonas amylolytica TaxID=449663 RepID=A0ABQ2PPR7_9NEIS|nr:hypothetical protein GCM10010971_30530 [Silvimonas amylolytica]